MPETQQERDLRHRICEFLRTPAVRRVNFRFGSVQITPDMLEAVALRLQDWHQIVRPAHGPVRTREIRPMGVRITTSMPSYASAAYDPTTNQLQLRSATIDSTNEGLATILHEGVHASQDVACRPNHAFPDESVAFLAKFVWFRAINRIPVPHAEVEVTAHNLSARVLETPGYSFTVEEQNRMMDAVRHRYAPHGYTASTVYDYHGVPIQ